MLPELELLDVEVELLAVEAERLDVPELLDVLELDEDVELWLVLECPELLLECPELLLECPELLPLDELPTVAAVEATEPAELDDDDDEEPPVGPQAKQLAASTTENSREVEVIRAA